MVLDESLVMRFKNYFGFGLCIPNCALVVIGFVLWVVVNWLDCCMVCVVVVIKSCWDVRIEFGLVLWEMFELG